MEEIEVADNKIKINEKYCISCGIYEKLAPENFKVENKKAKVIDENIEDKHKNKIKKAEKKCSANAIILGDVKKLYQTKYRDNLEH